MKSIITVSTFLIFSLVAISQPRNARKMISEAIAKNETRLASPVEDSSKNNSENVSDFLRFYIPSSITTEGIEPAAVSSFNLGFGDDNVKLKWGFSRNKDEKKFLKNSFGMSIGAKAPEGAKSLFQFDKTPSDMQIGLAFTKVLNEISYSYRGIKSSEEAYWLNVNLNYSRSKDIIFSDDTSYSKVGNNNFSFLVSINHYFNSWFNKKYTLLRNVWNLGIGIGHFSNIDDLDDITLRKGFVSGQYFTESESVIGKKGIFSRDFGLIVRGSLFYPISHPESKAYLMLGINANSFGIGTSKFTANSNGGIYISKREYDDGVLTDKFSFGILGDYSALENWGTAGYGKKNFKVVLVSQIPLRWR